MAGLRLSARRLALLYVAVFLALFLTAVTGSGSAGAVTILHGRIESHGRGLPGYNVSLHASFADGGAHWKLLGSGVSDGSGEFHVSYRIPKERDNDGQPVLFVEAEHGNAMLASAIAADSTVPASVVVNEQTTVATGNAFAQFVNGRTVHGNLYGMKNAVRMAGNLASPETGAVGIVLDSAPNGTDTSTLATFNSLSNAVAGCVASESNCAKLFAATTPAGAQAPSNVLVAIANLVKNPSYPGYPNDADDPIFALSQSEPVYQPALNERPTSWLLFLRITGGFYSKQDSNNLMNGPGNFAIDDKGFAWLNDNYRPKPPDEFTCAGRRVLKFYPWGEPVPDTPFFGGGLSGAGFGITLDPSGHVWVANFGFQDPPCALLPQAAKHNSVSEFDSNGTPLSPPEGFTGGEVSYPQGTVSDHEGNIWIGNCGSDSVTLYRGGNPRKHPNVSLRSSETGDRVRLKPFGLTTDLAGNVWTANNGNSTLSVVSPEGELIATVPGSDNGKIVLTRPMGIASDVEGNVWVANSDYVSLPCPTPGKTGPATHPSITLFQSSTRAPYPDSPFTGGGLTLPWGVTVDGDDTVWIFNFGAYPLGSNETTLTGISRFCGVNTNKCPAGMKVGQAISPFTGYRSDALERITAGQIDPSGNIWLTNNWRKDVNPVRNPGGNALVIAIGAAGPIVTPLIGPPVPFSKHSLAADEE
ncbi:MAG TPA: hypothetical protein VH351_01015 [Bryobacteraceae bacterium]|jgi:hypothetical protein|nr:hypothetical protein [Bryobacteraceae bacterium]